MIRAWVSAAAVLLLPLSAFAAQDDGAALKKKILEEVEKKLRAEETRILKEIEKIIDQELRKAAERKADPAPVAPHPRKAEPEKAKARAFLGVRPENYDGWKPGELEKLKIKGG